MKFILALFLLIMVGLVGWYGYCVRPVIDDFQTAVESGKPEALLPFMDIPSLKRNVLDYVKLRYNQPGNPSANLSPEAVQAIADSFVTPANILLMMKGIKMEPGSNLSLPDTPPPAPPIEKHYQSPDVYAVDIFLSPVKTPDNKMTLLFERDGWFGWKLEAFGFAWNG